MLKNDKRFIGSAAGKAEKAVDLILGAVRAKHQTLVMQDETAQMRHASVRADPFGVSRSGSVRPEPT